VKKETQGRSWKLALIPLYFWGYGSDPVNCLAKLIISKKRG